MFNLFLYIVFNLFPGQNSPIRTFIPTLRIVYVLCSKTPGIRRRFPLVSPIYRLITENESWGRKYTSLPHPSFFFIQYIQYSRSTLIFSFLSDVTDETKKSCEVIYRLPILYLFSNFSVNISIYFRVVCQYLSFSHLTILHVLFEATSFCMKVAQ